MSNINIEKASAAKLHAQKAPYTSVGNKTVELIANPDSLAIWTYLQTRAPGWKVIGSYLQDHFGMGRVRYRKAMKYLADMRLITHLPVRDEDGRMAGTRIIVHYQPRVTEPDASDAPRVQDSERSESASLAETTPYVINQSSNQSIKKINNGADAPTASVPEKKEKPKFDPLSARPDNVSEETWSLWCQHRKEIRKRLTPTSCKQQARSLAGHPDPDAVIRQSISNGWTGLFPDKAQPTRNSRPRPKHTGLEDQRLGEGLKADPSNPFLYDF